jgi:hypothetical protein
MTSHVPILLLSRCLMPGGEILEQQAVYEDVPSPNLAQKDTSRSIVEKADVI